MITWILALMVSLQPIAPWDGSYLDTAFAIAEAAEAEPLFEDEKGPEETAALLVAIANFESAFDPHAIGDGGQSIGVFQISKVHARGADLMDPSKAAHVALRLIRTSFVVCRNRPPAERLGWYAWGRQGCDHSLEKSRLRVHTADKLLREIPPFSDDVLQLFL